MIQIETQGRLGNHFFQYAMVYATAKSLNTNFRIRRWYKSDLPELCVLETSGNGLHRMKKSQIVKWYNKLLDKLYHSKKYVTLDDFESFVPQDGVIYNGYYQSDKFFRNFESEIRKEFKFKKRHLDRFDRQYSHLFKEKNVLAVHVRRGDYLNVSLPNLGDKGMDLPIAFYRKNIEKLKDENTQVVFVSDDIDFVKKEFKEDKDYIFSKEDKFLDFILLSKADKVIISNSSFSWWAAFLNENTHKRVIAPKYYLGFKVGIECPKGIMYEGFDWVNV